MMRLILLLLSVMGLSSCSLFSPAKNTVQNTYVLSATPSLHKKVPHTSTLLVAVPQTSPIYNTQSIAYVTVPYRISYFARSQWAATPSVMLQPLIIQTLQNGKYFKNVVGTPTMAAYQYVLNTQLLEFQQNFLYHPNVVEIKLRANIIRSSDARIIASKEFLVVKEAPEASPYGGVIAANEATETLLTELALFCYRSI